MELEEPDTTVYHELVKKRGFDLPENFYQWLVDYSFVPTNAEFYAGLLREESKKRQLEQLSCDISSYLVEGIESDEILMSASDRLKVIAYRERSADIASPDDMWESFFAHRERVMDGKGAVPTGFYPLDTILGSGMLCSGLYVLAARPGMGKTTFALQIADSIAEKVGPVLFVSLEMAIEQIQGKRIARVTGISSNDILLGKDETLDYEKIVNASYELKLLPLYVSRRPSATVAQIRRMAKSISDLKCLVVDYIGKIEPKNPRVKRYESITEISGDLKTLAVELGIPVFALSQLNRENTARQDKRPQLSDLRDSGAVEQDADGVIMLHRSDYYEMSETPMNTWDSVELEIIVRKNRHGRIGSCTAGFYPATGKIVPMR